MTTRQDAPEPSPAPRVGVVVPTRGGREALERAVRSVRAQTFQDWELVLVDDNGDGPVRERTKALVARAGDPRIRWVPSPGPPGAGRARNLGIRATTAPLVAFLDDDDTWLAGKLAAQVPLFERPARSGERPVGLVYCGFFAADLETGRVRLQQPRKLSRALPAALLWRHAIGTTTVAVCRRDALLDAGLFDERLPARQDVDLYLRLARDWSFDCVREPLAVHYSYRGARITNDHAARADAYAILYEKYRGDLISSRRLHSRFLQKHGRELVKAGRPLEARDKFRASWRAAPWSLSSLGRLLRASLA